MALLDVLALFADKSTAIQAAAGTVLLPNQYDIINLRDIGNGKTLWLNILVTADIVTAGAAGTIRFDLASDSTAAIASDGSQSVHFSTPSFKTDDDPVIKAGYAFMCPIPVYNGFHGPTRAVAGTWNNTGPGAPYEEFVGIQAVIGTTTITGGSVSAWLGLSPAQAWRAYANAVGA